MTAQGGAALRGAAARLSSPQLSLMSFKSSRLATDIPDNRQPGGLQALSAAAMREGPPFRRREA